MSDYGFDRTLRAFDRSMGKLGLDVLDLYLVHWPVPAAFGETIATYRATMRLLDEGRIRAIGVSNFRPVDLKMLIDQTKHTPAVNQVELHPFFNQAAVRAVNTRRGIITQAWSPIGGINRYGKNASDGALNPLSHPTVAALAAKYGKSPAQVILRWQLDLGLSPIPKSVQAKRIAENLDIFDFVLTPSEVAAIVALDTGARGGPDPEHTGLQTFNKPAEE